MRTWKRRNFILCSGHSFIGSYEKVIIPHFFQDDDKDFFDVDGGGADGDLLSSNSAAAAARIRRRRQMARRQSSRRTASVAVGEASLFSTHSGISEDKVVTEPGNKL